MKNIFLLLVLLGFACNVNAECKSSSASVKSLGYNPCKFTKPEAIKPIDRCNPYVKKPIRQVIECSIDGLTTSLESRNSSRGLDVISAKINDIYTRADQRWIKKRKLLLEALDAHAISQQRAREEFSYLLSEEKKEYAEIDDNIRNAFNSAYPIQSGPTNTDCDVDRNGGSISCRSY